MIRALLHVLLRAGAFVLQCILDRDPGGGRVNFAR